MVVIKYKEDKDGERFIKLKRRGYLPSSSFLNLSFLDDTRIHSNTSAHISGLGSKIALKNLNKLNVERPERKNEEPNIEEEEEGGGRFESFGIEVGG